MPVTVASSNQILPIMLELLGMFQNIIDTHHRFKIVVVSRAASGSGYLMH